MSKPNFLILGGDHFRHDAMGWCGNPCAVTPNLDALAARSMRFTHCFNQSPVCSPARHSLATGQYAHRHGVVSNGYAPYVGMRTVGHLFEPLGYRRINIGHMHWHAKGGEPEEPHHGFEPWITRDGFMEGMSPAARAWRQAVQAAPVRRRTGGPAPGDRTEYPGYWDSQHAIAKLEECAANDDPFLLWCAFSEPHPPFYPPRKYYELVPFDQVTVPEQPPAEASSHPRIAQIRREWDHLTDHEVRQIIRAYYGLVAMLDEYIGEVLETLERLGVQDNTYIVWFADHGDQLYEHRMFLKFQMREAAVRTPLMIAGPGIEPGQSDALVEHVDLLPTLCELAGIPIPEWNQGRPLNPLLDGQTPDDWRDAVFSQIYDGDRMMRMIRTEEWKLNVYGEEPGELFHLAEDPDEFVDRISDPACAAVRDDLFEQLRAWYRDCAPKDFDGPRLAAL